MNPLRWLLTLGFGLLFSALTVLTAQAQPVQSEMTPADLVLRFDASAASLDQVSIRAAIAQELAMTLADAGSDQAATLIVSVTTSGDLQLTYRPAREVLTRSVPVTNTSDVPRLLAHLAGNLVRDEASSLIAELQPPVLEVAPPAAPTQPTPATRPPTRPRATHPALALAEAQSPYLHDAWIFSVMGGVQLGQVVVTPAGPSYVQLVLQQSKRFGDLEVGLGMRIAYGALDVLSVTYEPTGEVFDDMKMGAQLTVPVSLEYRVIEDKHGYLQLGGSIGLQAVGAANGGPSISSGSDVYATLGIQATAGFRLARQHGLVLRVGWSFFPTTQTIFSGDYTYRLSPLQPGFNLGWQIGW